MTLLLMPILVALTIPPVAPGPHQLPEVAVNDMRWFPAYPVVRANYLLAKDHVAWLETAIGSGTFDGHEPAEWYAEAVELKQAWWELHEATELIRGDPNSYYEHRLRYCQRLRCRLGPEQYFAGRMPAPVPLKRFRRMER